jgi:hypothetical protein
MPDPQQQFRKKPVVISAIRWTGVEAQLAEVFALLGENELPHAPDDPHVNPGLGYVPPSGELSIPTLEGTMTAKPGDWIIRGIKGELYPCKADIFAATYESVEAVSSSLESRHDEQSYGEKRVGFTRLKAAGNLKAAPPAAEAQPHEERGATHWCTSCEGLWNCAAICPNCGDIPAATVSGIEAATETAPQSQREMMMAPLPKGVEDTPEIRQRLQDWVDGTSELRAALREKEAELATAKQELDQSDRDCMYIKSVLVGEKVRNQALSRELERLRTEIKT